MSQIDVNSLLQQMRSLSSQVEMPASSSIEPTAKDGTFGDLLRHSIDEVAASQNKAGAAENAFERGDPNMSLSQVMVMSQKAGLSFRAMNEVRNKLVDAYKNVMNMPI